MPDRKNLIIFDIDGTLTDSVTQHQTAFVSALKQMGVKEINTDFKIYKHHTDSHIAKVIYELDRKSFFGREQLSLFEALLWKYISTDIIKEIKGALNMVHYFEAESDFGVCYATGSLYKPATYKLSQAGIKFAPELLVASNETEDRETIVKTAVEQAKNYYQQSQFDRIISIGDGLWDLLTARNLGYEFIGIGTQHKEILTSHGMTLHFDDWLDFDPSRFNALQTPTGPISAI